MLSMHIQYHGAQPSVKNYHILDLFPVNTGLFALASVETT